MIDRKLRFVIPAALAVLAIVLRLATAPYAIGLSHLLLDFLPMILVVAAVALDDRAKRLPALICSGAAAAITLFGLAWNYMIYFAFGFGYVGAAFVTLINLFYGFGFILTFIFLLTSGARRSLLWIILLAAFRAGYPVLAFVISPQLIGLSYSLTELLYWLPDTLLFAAILLPGLVRADASYPAAAAQPEPADLLEAYKKSMYNR